MISVQNTSPLTTSIRLFHAKLLCERTVSIIAHIFCGMVVAEIPKHSANVP